MKLNKYSQNIIASSSEFEKEKHYWLEKLGGDIEINSFITDHVYDESIEAKKEFYNININNQIYNRISQMAKGSDYAVYMILLSGIQFLLSKYNNNEDIVLGIPTFKQNEKLAYVNNMLVLRNNITSDSTFKEVVKNIKFTISEAQENQNFPLIKIAEILKLDTNSMFKTIALLKNIQDLNVIKDIKTDIAFIFELKDNLISLEIQYNSNLFSREYIKQIGKHLLAYYNIVSNRTDIKLKDINILDKNEEMKIESFNSNYKEIPNKTVIEFIESKVKENPYKVAIVHENNKITYEELNNKANQLASYLINDRKVKL
ncbi:condensation domain-containing protein, partial [Clostridium sp. C8-1-8]|uniref:condensation domain-containing protein n=1 Tax=Clostridium sp. C8-1-8 TaxID=2698831 RepID=UPI001FACE263